MGLNKVFRMQEIRACLKVDGNDLAARKGNEQKECLNLGP